MVKTLIKEFPLTEIGGSMTEERIKKYTYTKEEVDRMIAHAVQVAVAEAQRIDEESMKKHNRDATVISMILGLSLIHI